MKTNFLKLNKILKIKSTGLEMRGFTIGLALVIIASMLLISVSISTLLIRDLKNAAANEKSVIAYNLAESALECIINYENNIRYYDDLGNNITGLFPVSKNYLNTFNPYASNELPKAEDTSLNPKNGYSYKTFQVGSPDNKFVLKKDIKCFGNEILSNINPSTIPSNNDVYTILQEASLNPNSPSDYIANGVVTSIKIKKDINYNPITAAVTSQNLFSEYLQKSCVDINIYATLEGSSYKKLISVEASVPCNSKNAIKRVLVRYIQ
jgi:hypothetical protein